MIAPSEITTEPAVLQALRQSPSNETIRAVIASDDAIAVLAQARLETAGTSEAWFIELRNRRGLAGPTDRLRGMVLRRAKSLSAPSRLHLVDREEAGPPALIIDVLPVAPIAAGAIVPAGYRLTAFAVMAVYIDRRTELPDYKDIAPAPVLITERHVDVETHRECVTLAWYRDDAWKTHICDRDEVMTAQKLTALSAIGFPVTSGTASDLVTYLAKFDAANLDIVARNRVSERFGWHEAAGTIEYLWGSTSISTSTDETSEYDATSCDVNGGE